MLQQTSKTSKSSIGFSEEFPIVNLPRVRDERFMIHNNMKETFTHMRCNFGTENVLPSTSKNLTE